MDKYQILINKLESFIRRFYLNELMKGTILFISIGLLYFLATLLVEYFLWLNSIGRSILFWFFVLVESLLLLKFIFVPLFRLFKLSKGIGYFQASRLIGNHFPEIKDKLLNVLQLKENHVQSELILAGIDQKANELQPVPFSLAVNFKNNLGFLKYTVIPVGIIILIFFTGNSSVFADSYERLVNYKIAYEPPAPFYFEVLNNNLEVRENTPFKLMIKTEGKILPENVALHFNKEKYFLTSVSPGIFEYSFEGLHDNLDIYFSANGVISKNYRLEVVKVPKMLDFEMTLKYPPYTGLKDEILKGHGNSIVPEGTKIKWQLQTSSTREIAFILPDTTEYFLKQEAGFTLKKSIYNSFDYQISSSNEKIKDHENFSYSVEVIKDQFPSLDLDAKKDTVDLETWYFHGKVSDDYGISKVNLVYYPVDDTKSEITKSIPVSKSAYGEFLQTFPDTLSLKKGKTYKFYFQVFDNDATRNFKSIKSAVFTYKSKTDEEIKEAQLLQQNEAIEGMKQSLDAMELSEQQLQELSRSQKEKGELNYNDRKKLENFIKRQKQQNELMKKFSEKLKKGLEDLEKNPSKEFKNQLSERLERKEEDLKENEKLLEELEKYSEKILNENFDEKLEQLSKNNQNQEKSLEQLLELTKRYYVEEKSQRISRTLEEQAQKQEMLLNSENENTKDNQEHLNSNFQDVRKSLKELKRENNELKKPMDLDLDSQLEEKIESKQKDASEELEKGNTPDAKKKQESAAKKMKELSKKIQREQQTSSGEQLREDANMLRQILDNLLIFSFWQEDLLQNINVSGYSNLNLPPKLKKQNELKEHFTHVDDSLFSLALRNPMITESITEKITDIEYDLNKVLVRFADNEIREGMSSQQYVITGANDLAYYLNEILGNMEELLSSSDSGEGDGEEIQLPDLIRQQGELIKKMEEGIKNNENQNSQNGNEKNSRELFEIFQQQQLLRQALEELEQQKKEKIGQSLEEEMQQIEEDLLKDGFNQNTLKKMREIEFNMLEMEDAEQEEGERPERESNTNKNEFENLAKDQIIKAREYFNTTEILKRQTLPLRQIYKLKVKEYFERGDN